MIENRISSKIVMGGGGKIPSISAIRLFAMLCIIACHFCQYYDNEWAWWLNVGVQIFFIVSGFLYGNKEIAEPISWLKTQFLKILIPYYIFLVFAIIGYSFVSPELLGIRNIVGSLFTIGQIQGIRHLWFVSYILLCYLITPYLAALRDYLMKLNIWRIIFTLVAIFGILAIIGILINGFYRPGRVDCYILGYYSAVLMKRYGRKVLHYCFWASILPCFVFNAIFCLLHYSKGMEMTGYLTHITDYSHLFLGYVITLLLMFLFQNITYNKLLKFSDRFSYEIYLVHQLFILSPLSLLSLTDFLAANIIITIGVIILSAVILQYISFKLRLFVDGKDHIISVNFRNV